MAGRSLVLRDRLFAEVVATLYVVAVALGAQLSGWLYVLFPALGALSHDVLTRPWGKWASQPARLIITPAVAAAIGTLVTREFPYRVSTILLSITVSLLLLAAFKSNIAPAIAAGMLPLVLGIKSWLYPASIVIGLVALVAVFSAWRTHYRRKYQGAAESLTEDIDDLLETPPAGIVWIPSFYVFVTVMALCATGSGIRLVLFPPLIVMAYEMFAHPATCPWAGKPLALPLACSLTAIAGWLAVSLFGRGGVAAACAMVLGIIVLRVLRIHMPPALAIGLLPLIIHCPSIRYPVSVTIGASALTLSYLLYRRWIIGAGRVGECAATTPGV